MIEVLGLTRKYGEHTAVSDLSFSVQQGQICGFLGPNGAGKSTTMNIITGYLGLTDGTVTVGGYDVLLAPEDAKRQIGYLPESPPLYNDMTPREYLSFAAELKRIPKSERRAAIDEAMSRTGIEDVQHRLIANLSKGYRQRVGISQAVLGLPPVLILDEPTSGLDPRQIREIRALIRELASKHTIILSSHVLSEVRELCDRIVIIHRGRKMADGTLAELEGMSYTHSFELTVKTDDPEGALTALRTVPDIADIEAGEYSDGELNVTVRPHPDSDPREDIFKACAAANLPILMMRPPGSSLEEVFLRLTSDEVPSGDAAVDVGEEPVNTDEGSDSDDGGV